MNGQYRIGDTVMKNWVIKKKLGEGSFGKVYRIEREEFGEVYHAALKIITVPQSEAEIQAALEEGMSAHEAEQYFYGMVEDIVREFALMARLKGTAHVVSYEDHEVLRHTQGLGWDILIRMEELTSLLPYAYSHPFTRRDIIQLGIDMCRGLELCQKYNIIHRDIKPENIFVSENGDFKLGDFGIARTVEKTMSGLSKKGTYNYMAPEVYKGQEYGFSVDIYSLGIVLYRLLNKNRVPFLPPAPEKLTYMSREQALARRMSGDVMPLPCYGQGRLGEIVLKATAYDPKDRYSSPGQMRQELEAILYSEADAEVIYPEGDEITLKENIYATMERDRFHKREDDEDEKTASAMGRTGTFGTAVSDDDEEATVSSFGNRNAGTAAGQRLNQTKVGREAEQDSYEDKTVSAFGGQKKQKAEAKKEPKKESKKESKKSGKGGVAVVAVIAVVAVVGGVMLFGGKGGSSTPNPNKQNQTGDPQETAAAAYQKLYDDAEKVFDSDPEKAMKLMDQALALYPNEPAAKTDYAYALYRTSQYDACITYIEKDLALGREFETELYGNLMEILGAAYYEKGDYAQAAVAFKSSAMGGEMSESAMRDYAVCLARMGSAAEAKDVLAQLRGTGANTDVTKYVEGEVVYASGTAEDLAEAEQIFQEILYESRERTIQVRAMRSLSQLYRDCYNRTQMGEFGVSPIETPSVKQTRLLSVYIEELNLGYDTSLFEELGRAAYAAHSEAQKAGLTVEEDYRLVAIRAFEHVIDLGMKKDYLYTNIYSLYYELGDYDMADITMSAMEEVFPKSYIPHALRGILWISGENQKPEAERDYTYALDEYNRALEKVTSSDDRGYLDQLAGLIQQLKDGNWL